MHSGVKQIRAYNKRELTGLFTESDENHFTQTNPMPQLQLPTLSAVSESTLIAGLRVVLKEHLHHIYDQSTELAPPLRKLVQLLCK